MKFGIFYEHQIPRPWQDGDESRLFHDALAQVELADHLGIEYVWAVEHHFLEEYSHCSAPEVFLAACSQRTQQIRLGHGIALMPPGYNHPARVAERIATLDLVSDGRVEWGTGKSSSRIELEGFQINPDERHEMWLEAVSESAKMLAAHPYPGHDGQYFSMPSRNIVPKPVQKPHPPLWVACSNRETIRLAAQLGLGALCFAFIDPENARYWVEEYYDTFKNECEPIGQTVNPNVAMVTGFMCHEDRDTAVQRGLEGFQFFGYALSHFYIHGTHLPGSFDLWQDFQKNRSPRRGPTGCIGNPADIRVTLETFEAMGVDQIIFLQQAGNNRQDHIIESLELFGEQILPDFKKRQAAQARHKAEELAPFIEKALSKLPFIPEAKLEPVESYPVLMQLVGMTAEGVSGGEEMVRAIAGEAEDETNKQDV